MRTRSSDDQYRNLDEQRLSFAGAKPVDPSCAARSSTNRTSSSPSALLREMTFSVNLYGNDADRARCEAFLAEVERS